jgi:hypothetical protein
MKQQTGSRGIALLNSFTTSAIEGDAFPPRKKRVTHCVEGWVGLWAGLGGYEKSRLHRDSNAKPSSP